MSGLFEHMANFDDTERTTRRQAAAVAQKRVSDRFDHFIARAGDDKVERQARLDLIADDIRQIVADVAEEYGADTEKLQEAIDEHLEGDGVTDVDGELEEAPSAVGSKAAAGHASDCTCGFCQNKGNLPGSDKKDDDKSDDDSEADDKSEPKESDDDESDDKPDFLDSKDSAIREALTAKDFVLLADAVFKAPGDPHALAQHFADYLGTTNPGFDRDRFIAAATGNPASERDRFQGEIPVTTEPQMPMPTAAVHEADADKDGGGAVKRESLPTGDETALGGPSPKIDKKEWKPNALNDKGNLKPIDTEQEGSPNPTEKQDVDDKADHGKDFLDQTDAVTETQSLPSADDSGQSTEKNLSQESQGGSWHTTEGQADPVTSSVDPDANPLEEILKSEFATDQQVESAIQAYKVE